MTDRPYKFLQPGEEPPADAIVDVPEADLIDGWTDIADEEWNTHLNHWHFHADGDEEFTLSLRVAREDVEPMHGFPDGRWCIEWYPSPDSDHGDCDYLMVEDREEAIEAAGAVMLAACEWWHGRVPWGEGP